MIRRALRVIIATVVAFVIAYLVLSNLPAFKLRETPGDADYFKNNLKHFYIFKTAIALTVGVFAGVICWWIDKGETWFLNIQYLQDLKNLGKKSIHYPDAPFYNASNLVPIKGKKKRVFFNYDMEEFLNEIQSNR